MDSSVFLSVIVVTWNNENYIEQALYSCIQEGLTNYEVIVVHNASDDKTGELIQRVVSTKPSLFKIIENEKNEGLGPARNIGMDHADGEYIMFLDGDDYFESNSFERIGRLLKDHQPDTLIINYRRVWDTGYSRKNKLTGLLIERDVSDPNDRVKIIRNFCSAWNKVYKKSFINLIKARFPNRYYEDIVWSFKSIFFAKTCYCIPDTIINYRQHHSSITKTVDARHMDILKQYHDLFNVIKANNSIPEKYIFHVYEHARNQLLNVIDQKRLPRSLEGRYLTNLALLLYDFRRLLNITKRDTQLKVASLGVSSFYRAFKKLKYNKVLLKSIKKKYKHKIKIFIYKHIYLHKPICDNQVYLESFWGKRFSCNPLAIAKELSKFSKYEITVGLKKNVLLPKNINFKVVRIGSLRYYKKIATSKYFISNVNFENNLFKRENQIHIQTQHGTPLKYMGIDIRSIMPKAFNWRKYARRCRRWDYVLSSNNYSSYIWRRSAPYEYNIIESGYPRNDLFFDISAVQINNIKNNLNIPLNKKIAVYAPTFRDYDKKGLRRQPVSLNEMIEALGSDYILLYRGHHITKNKYGKSISNIINVSDYPVSNEIFSLADLLITDYSSSMFDFANLGRPIVLFQYDYDEYTEVRGTYFDISMIPPGAIVYSAQELVKILRDKSFLSDKNMNKLDRFRKRFCTLDDGHAASRVIATVFD